MNIQFRPARPQDQEEACPLIYSAAPEVFGYLFTAKGKTPLDFLRFSFTEESGLFGFKNHIVATLNGDITGIGAFYSGKEYQALALGNTKQVFQFFGLLNGWKVLKRCLQIQKLIPPPHTTPADQSLVL